MQICRKIGGMKRVFWLVVCLFLISCTKPLSEPEESDPIYKDLQGELANAQKFTEEKQKVLEESRLLLNEAVPQTGQNRKYHADFYSAENDYLHAQQVEEFFNLRVKSRKFAARRSYLESFDAGKPWPDPNDFEEYLTNKRLKAVDKNWRKRGLASQKKSEKKKEGEGGEPAEGNSE